MNHTSVKTKPGGFFKSLWTKHLNEIVEHFLVDLSISVLILLSLGVFAAGISLLYKINGNASGPLGRIRKA